MLDIKCVGFLSLCLAVGVNAVSFIDPCHYDDEECIKKSSIKVWSHIENGVPELGIPSFKRMVIPEVNADNGDLKLHFKNLTVTTLEQCKIIKINRPTKLKAVVKVECPVTVEGYYKVDGKLALLPIEGHGECKISTSKAVIEVIVNLKKLDNGPGCYKFTNFDFKYEIIGEVTLEFHNLFNGDKTKAEPVNALLKESPKEFTETYGGPVIKELITAVVKAFENIFLKLSCKELELD